MPSPDVIVTIDSNMVQSENTGCLFVTVGYPFQSSYTVELIRCQLALLGDRVN